MVTRPEVGLGPVEVAARPSGMEKVDAFKTGGQNLITSVVVPVNDVDAMHNRQRIVNQVGKPLALAGVCGGHVPAQERLRRLEPGKRRGDFVVRLLCAVTQQRNVHQSQAAAPVQVRPAQPMRGGNPAKQAQRPFGV